MSFNKASFVPRHFTDTLRNDSEDIIRSPAGPTPSPLYLNGRTVTPGTAEDNSERTQNAARNAMEEANSSENEEIVIFISQESSSNEELNAPSSDIKESVVSTKWSKEEEVKPVSAKAEEKPSPAPEDAQARAKTTKLIRQVTKKKFSKPAKKVDIEDAYDKMKAFQKANASKEGTPQSPFPCMIDSKKFGVLIPSSTTGYISSRVKSAKGSNKKHYKLVKVEDKSEGGHRVSSKAGLLITKPRTFKNNGFVIDPFEYESEFIMKKSEFKWETDDFIYFVKDLFDGDIKQLSEKNGWDFNKRLEVMIQCCQALKDAHDHGYVIRDVKLDNFFMKDDQVVIGDEDAVVEKDQTVDPSKTLMNPLFDKMNNPSPGTDMFAFGGCLIKMFESIAPPSGLLSHFTSLARAKRKLDNLIQDLRQKDISKRPSAQATLNRLASIK